MDELTALDSVLLTALAYDIPIDLSEFDEPECWQDLSELDCELTEILVSIESKVVL